MKIEDALALLKVACRAFNEAFGGNPQMHASLRHEVGYDGLVPSVHIWEADDLRTIAKTLGVDIESRHSLSGDEKLVAVWNGVALFSFVEEGEN